jgi:hypothetical protein
VYRARDFRLSWDVVIKVLNSFYSRRGSRRELSERGHGLSGFDSNLTLCKPSLVRSFNLLCHSPVGVVGVVRTLPNALGEY